MAHCFLAPSLLETVGWGHGSGDFMESVYPTHCNQVHFQKVQEACFLFSKLSSFILNKIFAAISHKLQLWPSLWASSSFTGLLRASRVVSHLIIAQTVFVFLRARAWEVRCFLFAEQKASLSTCFSIINLDQKWNFWSTEERQKSSALHLFMLRQSSESVLISPVSSDLCRPASSPSHEAGLQWFGFSWLFHV